MKKMYLVPKGLRLVQDPLSVRQARARLQMLNALAVNAGRVEMTLGSAEVVVRTRAGFPVATGQSRGGVHILEGKRTGKVFETGVGIRRTPNGQEVEIERGVLRGVHRTMEEHDPAGKRCSSGDPGGWGLGEEPVNVRAELGRLEANPNARQRPLYAAIVELHGDIVDGEAAAGFRKGVVNRYGPGGLRLGHSKLKEAIMRAVHRVLHVAVLAIMLVGGHSMLCPYEAKAQPPLSAWDKSNWRRPFLVSDTLAAGEVMRSQVMRIDDRWGSPQFFGLLLAVEGFGASAGDPQLAMWVAVGWDSAGTEYACADEAGDTLWTAVTSLGKKALALRVCAGDWFMVGLRNESGGDTVVVNADSTRAWMKH